MLLLPVVAVRAPDPNRASAVDKIMSAAAEELDDYPDIETWFEILEYVEENLDDFKAPSSRAVILLIAACLPACSMALGTPRSCTLRGRWWVKRWRAPASAGGFTAIWTHIHYPDTADAPR